jgi:phage protein U
MYAQLGSIVFDGAFGPTQQQSKVSQSIAQHALIDGKPRLQRLGVGLEELSLDLTLHSSFIDPEAAIAALRSAIEDGEVMPLLNGNGEFVGNFVVSEITNTLVQTDRAGLIILAKVSVSLIEYVAPDELGSKEAGARKAGFANADNKPLLRPIQPQNQGFAIDAMSSLTEVRSESAGVNTAITNAVTNPSVQASETSKALRGLKKMREALENYGRKLQNVRDYVDNYEQLQSAVSDTRGALDSTESALLDGDLNGAFTANQEMQRATSRTTGASANVAYLSATRKI